MWGGVSCATQQNLANPTQVVVSEKPNAKHQSLHLSKFAPSKVQITRRFAPPQCKWHLGFQAGGANLTWSRMLPRTPSNCGTLTPSMNPLKHALQNPLRNQRLNPLKNPPRRAKTIAPGGFFNPGQSFGSFDALGGVRPRLNSIEVNLETKLASRWEGVRLLKASGKSLHFPGSSPNFPGSSR